MPNPYGAPEISVQEISEKVTAGEEFVWLDVREPHELSAAHVEDPRVCLLPLSELARRQLDAIPERIQDKETPIIVFCHHGSRSAQVVAWLAQQGWSNALNQAGGIHAWAHEIDDTVGRY